MGPDRNISTSMSDMGLKIKTNSPPQAVDDGIRGLKAYGPDLCRVELGLGAKLPYAYGADRQLPAACL